MSKVILKKQISDLLKKLKEYDVYGPVLDDGILTYDNLEGKELILDFKNSQKPPKEFFFPQTEKMFDFKREGKDFVGAIEPEKSDRSVLLFGIRPCDANSLNVLDKLFSWDYNDPYYVDKRDKTTIISFSCIDSQVSTDSCFCTSVGGNPSSKEGSDMLWTDIGDSFYVESLTDKGKKILDLGGSLFKDASSKDKSSVLDVKKKAEKAITRTMSLEGVDKALESTFDHSYWDVFSKRCLGCGICTLLCPTCHCFDINDVVKKGKGWRERTWDTCQTSYYTIHASGHNPRPDKKHRQRNRIYHKFLYLNKNLDVLGCVGCGRCISHCPVNIDIIEVAEGVKEVA